jgi:hypothetical protein
MKRKETVQPGKSWHLAFCGCCRFRSSAWSRQGAFCTERHSACSLPARRHSNDARKKVQPGPAACEPPTNRDQPTSTRDQPPKVGDQWTYHANHPLSSKESFNRHKFREHGPASALLRRSIPYALQPPAGVLRGCENVNAWWCGSCKKTNSLASQERMARGNLMNVGRKYKTPENYTA